MKLDKVGLGQLYDYMLSKGSELIAMSTSAPRLEWVAIVAQGRSVNRTIKERATEKWLYVPDDKSIILSGHVQLSEEERLLSALYFGCSVAAQYVSGRGIYIPALDHEAMAAHEILVPLFLTRGGIMKNPDFAGYEFKEKSEGDLLRVFQSGPRAAKTIMDAIAYNVAAGVDLPETARILAGNVLFGVEKFPSAPKGQPDNRHRDILFISLAERIAEAASKVSGAPKLHTGAAATSVCKGKRMPICGCSIAAAALAACGVIIPHARAFKIVAEKNKILQGVAPTHLQIQSGPKGIKSNFDRNLTAEDFDFRDMVFEAIDYLRRPV